MRTFEIPAAFFTQNRLTAMTAEQIVALLVLLALGLGVQTSVDVPSYASLAARTGMSASGMRRGIATMHGELLEVRALRSAGRAVIRISTGPSWPTTGHPATVR